MPNVATASLLLLMPLLLRPAGAAGQESARELQWEFRWSEEEEWRPVESPSNPPGRDDRSLLWLRTSLPASHIPDPAIFVYSIDTAATVYFRGEPIYSFPTYAPGDTPTFSGWPWHIIRLPEDSEGEELLVRVYSDYRDIGLWGSVLHGNRADLHGYIAQKDLPRFFSGTLLLAVGIISLLAFVFGPARWNYLLLFVIVILMALWTVASSYAKQYIGGTPLFWQYLESVLPMVIFAFVAELLRRFLSPREGGRYRVFSWIFAGGAVLSVFLPLFGATGAIPLYAVHTPQDVLFLLFWLTALVSGVRTFRRGDRDAIVFLGTFLLAGLVAAYSIPVSYNLVPWTDNLDHLALLLFALGLSIVVGRRFARVYGDLRSRTAQLESLNANLEGIVEQRTQELEAINLALRQEKDKLQRLSSIDDLTGLYNRRAFSALMTKAIGATLRRGENLLFVILDVDNLKELNDTYGHPVGDIVLRSVASVLSAQLRAGDFAGRFGGDEFVALLTGVERGAEHSTVERICNAIRGHDWFTEEYRVTVSFGAVLYQEERHRRDVELLVADADTALYEAKRAGRDRGTLFSHEGDA